MRHTFLTSFFCLPLFAAPLYAGFVLDDFDDPAGVVSPEMENVPIETSSVGLLNATRTIEIAGAGVNPVAEFEVADSSISASLIELNRTDDLTPIFAFQFNYDFTPTDISEAGQNNAILFDFESIQATESPLFLRVIVRDDTNNRNSYQNHVLNLPLSSGPFVAVMPFDAFTIRGGSPGLPDFTTIDEMDFDFFFLGPSEDIQWSAQLDRIRFGRVPEPLTSFLLVVGLLFSAGCRLRYVA